MPVGARRLLDGLLTCRRPFVKGLRCAYLRVATLRVTGEGYGHECAFVASSWVVALICGASGVGKSNMAL
jgi:hypothetical protein